MAGSRNILERSPASARSRDHTKRSIRFRARPSTLDLERSLPGRSRDSPERSIQLRVGPCMNALERSPERKLSSHQRSGGRRRWRSAIGCSVRRRARVVVVHGWHSSTPNSHSARTGIDPGRAFGKQNGTLRSTLWPPSRGSVPKWFCRLFRETQGNDLYGHASSRWSATFQTVSQEPTGNTRESSRRIPAPVGAAKTSQAARHGQCAAFPVRRRPSGPAGLTGGSSMRRARQSPPEFTPVVPVR